MVDQKPLIESSITGDFTTLELCKKYEEHVKMIVTQTPNTQLLHSECREKDKGVGI